MKVREIGMKKVYWASPDATLAELAAMMRDLGVGAVPICNSENQMLGLITDRDIVVNCIAKGDNLHDCPVSDFMAKNPKTITPNTELEEAARIMAQEQVRRLPVIENGKLVGMLSLGDISLALKENDSLVAETLRKISTHTPGRRQIR